MATYAEMSAEELRALHDELEEEYKDACAKGLSLNMARGKPGADQLDLSMPMFDLFDSKSDLSAADGTDCRNYGVLCGLPEMRAFFAEVLGVAPEQVIVFGNSSLNIMYDTVARALARGIDGNTPWGQLEEVRFLCPSPGYDRHFSICEHFGIEMIPIEMTPTGPDMGAIEMLVSEDASIKGIWCVPKYSNPQGISYSDETVRRFAALQPLASDFRIFWDNAYCVHHLYDEPERQDTILDIVSECERAGNTNMVYEFCSTSKITFPGSGVSAMASSPANIQEVSEALGIQTIGHDKINQLRHLRFLKDADGLAEHMSKHAALLRPKFEAVLDILERDLGGLGIGTWTNPRGGYFISFEGPDGTAKKIVAKAKEAGVTMTGAGATWPYKNDPADSNIRIAPTYPALDELVQAAEIFTLCVRLVAIEQLLEE